MLMRSVLVIAPLLMVACGSAAPASQRPTTSAATVGTTPVTTPTVVASTPAPPPPLAIVRTNDQLIAVDVSGQLQWAVDGAVLAKMLTATPQDIAVQVAGPHLVLSAAGGPAQPGKIVVLDRSGHPFGDGSFTNAAGASNLNVFADPTGTQWAWSVDDTAAAAPLGTDHHGRILVARLGVVQHSVYSWVAPMGFYEAVAGWTDMGIVMERSYLGGCGAGYHNDNASFLVDPVAGTLSDLYSNGDHYGDASHGVVAGYVDSGPAVLVNPDPPSRIGSRVQAG